MARNATPAAAVVLLFLSLASSSAAAFNITRILGEFSDFSTFNDLLTRNKLADEINRRQTITVLALDNGAASAVSSLPSDVQRKVLAVHVVLDYYDKEKLGSMKNRSAVLTTLFQSTGQATNRMGFVNYTKRPDGAMMFGSAEPGAPLTSEMVKPVVSRPYNISVLQVSSAIVPPSIGSTNSSSKVNAPSPAAAPAPAPSKNKKGAPAPKSDAPVPAPSPSDDSSADAPADATGPAADSPVADGPAHNKSSDDDGSAAGRAVVGAALRAVAVSLLVIIVSL